MATRARHATSVSADLSPTRRRVSYVKRQYSEVRDCSVRAQTREGKHVGLPLTSTPRRALSQKTRRSASHQYMWSAVNDTSINNCPFLLFVDVLCALSNESIQNASWSTSFMADGSKLNQKTGRTVSSSFSATLITSRKQSFLWVQNQIRTAGNHHKISSWVCLLFCPWLRRSSLILS